MWCSVLWNFKILKHMLYMHCYLYICVRMLVYMRTKERELKEESHVCLKTCSYRWDFILVRLLTCLGFPGGSDSKEPDSNMGDLGWEDPLEKGMATHSSILAWRIPWTEKSGRLQSMGLPRVRHDWVTYTHTQTHTLISLVWGFTHGSAQGFISFLFLPSDFLM